MRMPNGDKAVVDIEKLSQYCLSVVHPRGRHKARVFESALGITAKDADDLRRDLLDAARNRDAIPADQDEYGARYVVDFNVSGSRGKAKVRSVWIVLADEDFPRFVSCYVL